MRKHPIIAAALAVGVFLLPGTGHAVGQELLSNTSFEESLFEPDPSLEGALPRPLMPTGWVFEGAAGLFDHTPDFHHTGARSIAITAPMSAMRELCAPGIGCTDNPGDVDWLGSYYSPRPYWRTLDPVPVIQGKRYQLEVWVSMEGVNRGEGAKAAVRWLVDGRPNPVFPFELAPGPDLINNLGQDSIGWTKIRGTVTVPWGIDTAYVMLGHAGGPGIGQIRFDDVSFRRL